MKYVQTIRAQDGYSRTDFSLYDGWAVTGLPRLTIRHGEIVYGNGKLSAHAGSGQLLRREPMLPLSLAV